ncbi:hypothetical protein KVV02_002486 [Mortierella alpina]|uniref:Fe2OG dioxygenase domain-containing protein n=1 Tax=Mortierella alpina TaxID=64518 RepID=A0A9P8A5J8_MORAP|nr:hypothetical protein KVV02_002486 [Mortierella alpina]
MACGFACRLRQLPCQSDERDQENWLEVPGCSGQITLRSAAGLLKYKSRHSFVNHSPSSFAMSGSGIARQMELELFGSSGSDSDSEMATKDVKARPGSRELQSEDFEEEDQEEADPIFDSIMACTEHDTSTDDKALTDRSELQAATPQHSPHPNIPGLCLHTNALSHEDQSRLMAQMTDINLFKGGQQNQAMRYGKRDLAWIAWLEERLKQNGVFSEPFCRSDWTSRAPLFDQSIMNLYRPGDGIKPHVDLARFEDGIVVVSLLSAINMDFYRALSPMSPEDPPEGSCQSYVDDGPERQPDYTVRLEPGSVITMEGPSRYDWQHGIQEVSEDLVNGERIKRKIRVSITLRRMRLAAWNVGPGPE